MRVRCTDPQHKSILFKHTHKVSSSLQIYSGHLHRCKKTLYEVDPGFVLNLFYFYVGDNKFIAHRDVHTKEGRIPFSGRWLAPPGTDISLGPRVSFSSKDENSNTVNNVFQFLEAFEIVSVKMNTFGI